MPRMKDFLRVMGCMVGQPNYIAPKIDMTGKTVVVTGPTMGGIGFEAAKTLATWGARTILAARNTTTADEACKLIRDVAPGASLDVVECDLSSLSSVDGCSIAIQKLIPEGPDVLLCNAGGIYHTPRKSKDGYELSFAVCALGHHKLIYELQPRRLVWVSGDIYTLSKGLPDPNFDGYGAEAYNRACLARILLASELKRRNQAAGIQMDLVCLHPGVISTQFMKADGLMKKVSQAVLLNPQQGAQVSILLTSLDSENLNQDWAIPYYHNKHGWFMLDNDDIAVDVEAARELFDKCDQICGIIR